MIAQMAARLHAQLTLEGALETILNDSIALAGLKCGTLRLLDETGGLVLVAQQGFDRYHAVSLRRLTLSAQTASGRAAIRKQISIIVDVEADTDFDLYQDFARLANFKGVMSIPMVAHNGICVGVITIFFGPHGIPNEVEQRMLETYGKIAADRLRTFLGSGPVTVEAEALHNGLLDRLERKDGGASALSRSVLPIIEISIH
jgi:GAF domain-containing protein